MEKSSRRFTSDNRHAPLTLIKGARIFTPDDAGRGDILLAGGVIALIEPEIEIPRGIPIRLVDGRDFIASPGLIDLHVHIAGGGGEGGPATRTPEIRLTGIIEAGVTTVVGLLGTDDISRTPDGLLAKSLGLEQDGLNSYILSGSYAFPPVTTITGALKKDLMLIPHVLGVGELAVSDHRSSEPTFEDLAKTAAEARVGGMLGNKAGIVNLHMGEGRKGFDPIFRLIKETDIPVTQFLPTHVNRKADLFRQAVEFIQLGGTVDMTIFNPDDPANFSKLINAMDELLGRETSLRQVTFSSDANGSMPKFDENGAFLGMGVGCINVLKRAVQRLIIEHGLPPETILPCVTSNPARVLKLNDRTGSLKPGLAGDVTLFDNDWNVQQVYCRGKLMVDQGRSVVSEAISIEN